MGCSSSAASSSPGANITKPKGDLVLGYWNGRGMFYGNVTRFLIAYSGTPCKIIEFVMGEDEWTNKKASNFMPFPNLPYITQGPFQLSETLAICQYICQKRKPELLGKTP